MSAHSYTLKALSRPLPLSALKGRDRAAADLLLAASAAAAGRQGGAPSTSAAAAASAALDVHVATFLRHEVGYGCDADE